MQTGKIGVTTENIFPIIKKFLYSDHEIFLRELISNAIDATKKLKTISNVIARPSRPTPPFTPAPIITRSLPGTPIPLPTPAGSTNC